MNKNQKEFIRAATEKYGVGATITRDQISDTVEESGCTYPFCNQPKGICATRFFF